MFILYLYKNALTHLFSLMLIMESGPITSWQIDGETVETGQTLFWGAPKSLQVHDQPRDQCQISHGISA